MTTSKPANPALAPVPTRDPRGDAFQAALATLDGLIDGDPDDDGLGSQLAPVRALLAQLYVEHKPGRPAPVGRPAKSSAPQTFGKGAAPAVSRALSARQAAKLRRAELAAAAKAGKDVAELVRAYAAADHADLPQYRGHWDGSDWQLVCFAYDVPTKMGLAFRQGDLTIARRQGGDWIAYSWRTQADTLAFGWHVKAVS